MLNREDNRKEEKTTGKMFDITPEIVYDLFLFLTERID